MGSGEPNDTFLNHTQEAEHSVQEFLGNAQASVEWCQKRPGLCEGGLEL